MTITPIMKIQRQKWGALGIFQAIDDCVFVYTCKVFYDMTKTTKSYAFVYESHFAQK